MKNFHFLIIGLLIGLSAKAQDSTAVTEPVIPPQIVIPFSTETPLKMRDYTIQLKKVIDSRCPTGTDCIWAGEVKVVVDILKNGKFVEEKTVNLSSRSKDLLTLLHTDGFDIIGHSVKPYPSVKEKIAQKDYKLNIIISEFLEK
ncbi:MAG: hypothetical protein WBG71_07425 [Leeuwenhoekiella sp.]